MPADQVLRMATMGGARALGIDHQVGSIEVGKRADLAVIATDSAHGRPRHGGDPASAVVYALQASDVSDVVVDGRVVVRDGQLVHARLEAILADAEAQRRLLLARHAASAAGAAR
jgi:5-methylthioadenosine/S-adenosylhomocysteine deaminase